MYATYLRNEGHDVIWGEDTIKAFFPGVQADWLKNDKVIENDFQIDIPFEQLPFPDRTFTDAKNKRWQSYGNYKYHPATHMMASNLCWWGKCTFCVDTLKLQQGENRGLRTVEHVMAEIDDLIRLGFKEVFDDSGTFPISDWLHEFCDKMIKSGRNKKIVLGCNMKPISNKVVPFKMMKDAGFRFMLVGVESANQATIDKIHKGQESSKVIENIKSMSDAGLQVHTTWMLKYPFETEDDFKRTITEAHFLLRKGYSHTAQCSIYMPPRTAPEESQENRNAINKFYSIYKDPRYWVRKVMDIRRIEDITYLLKRIGHVKHAE